MHINYLKVGFFIHIRKNGDDTFGIRLHIKEIKVGIIIATCLSDGAPKSLTYSVDEKNQQVRIQDSVSCTHLTETAGQKFIHTRLEFLKEQAEDALNAARKHEVAFKNFL